MNEQKKLVPKLRFPEFRGTKGWMVSPLGELGAIVTGKTPSTTEDDLWGGEIFFITPTDITDDNKYQRMTQRTVVETSGTKVLPPGSVLYTCIASIGKMALTVVPSVTNQQINAVVPNGKTAKEYVYYSLAKLTPWIKSIPATSTLPIINKTQFSSFIIPHPEDKAEQQKIADCLSSLDELIAAQARKVEALKTHKKGLMQQLFPREGETQPRLRFPEFQDLGEWKQKTLGEIADIKSGSTPYRANDEFFAGGTIPWVKTTDLNNSFITETEEQITPKAKARLNPVGSVLVAMYGGFNQIGRTGCLSVAAATNQAISVLQFHHQNALPAYVLAWLNSKVEDWKRIASSSRKDPNITGADVAKFPINLPGIPEQQRIADCLTAFDDLITAATQEFNTLKTHKKGLMQQLFPSSEALES
jgi:type I restriction enzyme S subunit